MSQPWQAAYLRALGAKPTPEAIAFLDKWQPWEGGHTKNDARFNYFNTSEQMPGSKPINSVGVQSYSSLAQGARAFAKTLLSNPHYAGLVNYLKTGQGDPAAGLATWVAGDPASAHGLAYASKVLGTPTTAPGSSNGRMAAPDAAGGGSTPSPGLLGTGSQAAAIREQAQAGLAATATGGKPTDQLAALAPLFAKLKSAVPTFQSAASGVAGVSGSLDAQAAQLVKKYLGVKYTWGGTDVQTGFDCSGLVQTVWKQLGVNVPRTTYDQWDSGQPVSIQNLKPGDAVFFTGSDPKNGKPGHEGMYIGNGRFIEAPGSGLHVRVSTLDGRRDFVGARRFS